MRRAAGFCDEAQQKAVGGPRPGRLKWLPMPSRIVLRAPSKSDQREFLARARASRALHGRWIQAPATPAAFGNYVERVNGPAHCGLLVCERDSGAIAGSIIISNVVMDAFRSGYTGYYAFAGVEGRGLMREGLQ